MASGSSAAVSGPAVSGPAVSGPAVSGPAVSGPAVSGPAVDATVEVGSAGSWVAGRSSAGWFVVCEGSGRTLTLTIAFLRSVRWSESIN